MRWRVAAEFLGFQAVWLACAWGAAGGSALPGVVAGALFVAAQLAAHPLPARLAALAAAGGALGFAVESALAAAGLWRHGAPWPGSWPGSWLAPAWLVALWLAYATTLPTTARLLGGAAARGAVLVKAAALGAVLGPLSYRAGAALGAIAPGEQAWLAYAATGAAWAAALPALLALARRLAPRGAGA